MPSRDFKDVLSWTRQDQFQVTPPLEKSPVERIAELWETATPDTVERDFKEAADLAEKLGTTERQEAQGFLDGLATLADQVRNN